MITGFRGHHAVHQFGWKAVFLRGSGDELFRVRRYCGALHFGALHVGSRFRKRFFRFEPGNVRCGDLCHSTAGVKPDNRAVGFVAVGMDAKPGGEHGIFAGKAWHRERRKRQQQFRRS